MYVMYVCVCILQHTHTFQRCIIRGLIGALHMQHNAAYNYIRLSPVMFTDNTRGVGGAAVLLQFMRTAYI